jgi:hypothetical protein
MATNFVHYVRPAAGVSLIRRWWWLYGHDGAVIAVWREDRVLAVRHLYEPRLPSDGKSEDDPEGLGLAHLHEARLEAIPALRIYHRETCCCAL